jgi:hypothetical protein
VARPLANIVEEILDHLRPLRGRRADIQSEVERRIAMLIQMAPAIDRMPRMRKVREQAATARKTLGRLRTELARAPLQSFIGPHISISQSVECLDRLDEILANTRLIKGPDPRSNPMQWLCAESADALIYQFSRRPATGTPEGPLHAIASLLYEAVTGKRPNRDLKRAVDAMIKSWRGLDCMGGRGRPLGKRSIEQDKWEHDVSCPARGVDRKPGPGRKRPVKS